MRTLRFSASAALILTAVYCAFAEETQLVGPGRLFIRFTNTRPDQSAAVVRLHVVPNSDEPFGWGGVTVYAGTDGVGEKPDVPPLEPGASSPWLDVGQYMNLQGARSWDTYLSPLLCGVQTFPPAPGLFLVAEIAEGPGMGIIRRIEVRKPDLVPEAPERDYPWHLGYSVWNHGKPILPTLGLLVPSRPEVSPRVYTLEEILNWQLDVIEAFPDVGRLPGRIVYRTHGQKSILDALGYNGYPEDAVEANLGDEISIEIELPEDEQNRRFREAMKSRGFRPFDLVSPAAAPQVQTLPEPQQWELVTLLPPLQDNPVHFYESAIFRYQLWYEALAARTRAAVEANPGKRVLAGANFSPHMNVWPDTRQWIGPFEAAAMTMTWTEDWWWQLPELSPQVYGFLLDGLRLAGSYHGAPMQFYIMPFKGNSPDNFTRMHGLALSHGAKIINHFHTEDQVLTTWDYVDASESPRTYQAIHDLIRDTGAVEDRLYSAMPRKADIAILLSWAADTWDTEDLGGAGHLYSAQFNANNDERKALWLALRHAQYPVDLITDKDVAAGRLQDYRVLFVVGAEMLAEAVEPLRQWVENGGTLYATAGGGLLDQYHRPNGALNEVYGILSNTLERPVRHIRPRNTLPKATPLDTVHIAASEGFPAVELPALLYRETFEPGAATVIGRYAADHAPAVLINRFGNGRAVYSGVLAGIAYITPACTGDADTLPTDFPADRRALISAIPQLAAVTPPVETSHPLVEAQYMQGETGAVVILTNWSPDRIPDLRVSFPGLPGVARVRSLRSAGHFTGAFGEQETGTLELSTTEGRPSVSLPLALVDYLFVD
ncbi:MAG TPA: beta-galactosidase trimerization domain-containing protein [Candidatus Hydrogenedentes bacterium]|nr:beta-galactosidase trimerization domain-containing protein [Candidatus Hydrogenedentota bacterium]